MKCAWTKVEETDGCSWHRCARCGVMARNGTGMPDEEFLAGMPDCGTAVALSRSPRDTLRRKARQYLGALQRWQEAGRPVRPEAEVNRIFAEQCKPCQYCRKNRCDVCGCRLKGRPLLSKIAMATEQCPLGNW